ncbi:hypothetical protein NIES4071_09410 [Calothrix sp. NIES-4071]|nr:hypothetical protein NIES4071_09410 [Calothrix sp. NIES-4071]BAZ55283.1 hypothetical protein NIES4105_09370 [Calothrix sp. NIES-4105]
MVIHKAGLSEIAKQYGVYFHGSAIQYPQSARLIVNLLTTHKAPLVYLLDYLIASLVQKLPVKKADYHYPRSVLRLSFRNVTLNAVEA